jgi:hypothetical protein
METNDEKAFDEQFSEILAKSTPEIRSLLEPQREKYKKLAETIQRQNDSIDKMLRARLGPLYPFFVPQGKEIPLIPLRPINKRVEKGGE